MSLCALQLRFRVVQASDMLGGTARTYSGSKFAPLILPLGFTMNFSVQLALHQSSETSTVSAAAAICDMYTLLAHALDDEFPRRYDTFLFLLLIFPPAMLPSSRHDEPKARDAGGGTPPKTCLMCRVMSIHIAKY